MDVILFLIFAIIAVVCAINVVVQTHPISSALSLVGVMGSLAILYLLLGAEFIAMVQVIVYAGAIMVLFVFVIMVLNAGEESRTNRSRMARAYFGLPLLALFFLQIVLLINRVYPSERKVEFGAFVGDPKAIGRLLFYNYLLPFEATSVLILVAIMGAVVLTRRRP